MVTTFVLCCSLSTLALASPPHGQGKKHKHKHHDKHHYEQREMTQQFWDGNCKVKRKWKHNGDYTEERKCHSDREMHDYGYVVVLPPWVKQPGGYPQHYPQHYPDQHPQPRSTAMRCNSEQVGNVLGGIIGGLLGHQVGGGSGNTIATVGGAIAGVLIGGQIGQRMDQRNQACIGRALEYAPDGQRITWGDERNGDQYAVVPGPIEQREGNYCRAFTAEMSGSGSAQITQGAACRQPDGTWVRSI